MSLLALAGTNSATGGYEIDNSIKIEPDNDEGLYFTPSSTTNTDTFTFSCWFKRTEISNQINTLFGSYTDGSNHALFRFKTDDTLELRFVTAGTGKILVSDMLFRDTSAWYHMVLAVDTTDGTAANRVKVYINGEQITLTGDYPTQNQDCIGINTVSKAMNVGYLSNFSDVEFAGYIAEAHHIDGSQLASTDFGQYDEDSGIWKPKAYTGSYGTNGFYLNYKTLGFGTSHRYWKYQAYSTTNHVPRASRIYLIKEDGSTENFKYYAADNCSDTGGIMNVATGSTTYSDDSNTEYTIDLGTAENVQGFGFYGVYDVVSRNVTAKLYYSDDGTTWTEDESHTFNTSLCGNYNHYRGTAGLGQDDSGNGNHFTLNNITAADQATDTPTNNFATLNPLMANAGPANYLPITEGGTKAVNTAAAYKIANSTFGVTSGKWYWEVKATDVNGVTAIGVTMPFYWDADYTLQGCIYYGQLGQRYNNASASSFGATYTDGDIISFALDMDATPPTMTVYKNNVSQGNLMAGLSINGTGGAFLPPKEDGYFPKVVGYNANTFECNFGGYTSFSISSAASDDNGYGTFEYAPPSGYYALCTKNLEEYG